MTLVRDPGCTRCPLHKTADFVCLLGKGPEPCDMMIIGEAPGKKEDENGQPFVGRSGKYLDDVIEDTGLRRKRIFITNAVSCRPPDNSKPTKKQIEACGHWLRYQIRKVKPKFVLLLGNVPLRAITGQEGITKARGKPFEKDGVVYLPTFHPSYILHGEYAHDPIFRQDFELFKSLVEGGGMPREKNLSVKVVETEQQFERMLRDLSGTVSLDIESTGLYPWAKHRPNELPEKYKRDPLDPRAYDAKLTSLGFGTRKHQYIMMPKKFELTKSRMARISEKLEDCIVAGHYAKFDALYMKVHYGVDWRIDFDTGLAHYMLDENTRHGLKELAQRFCGAPNWDVDRKTKQTFDDEAQGILYHAHDLYYTRKLKFIFHKKLEADQKVNEVFRKVMMPLVGIFVAAEFEGPFIDLAKMDRVEKGLRAQIEEFSRKLNKWAKINWGSPLQLAGVLFKKLKIGVITYGKKQTEAWPLGVPSTAETVLKQIDHPIIKDLMDLRAAKQQLSFFIEGWKPYLVKGRLHPSFKLTGTVTGRLSCEHPNLQQVPRVVDGNEIRTLIIAPPGWVLVEADLSQIELRIAAELAGERALIEAFANGLDPHWMTALNELKRGRGEKSRVLETAKKIVGKAINDYDKAIDVLLKAGADACVAADYAWKELRKKAKAINFGYLYGMGWRKFKQYARDKYDVILTDKQAQDSREAYFSLYRDLPKWHKRQREFARRNGYVRTLSGRKRRLPAAMSPDDSPERGEAERQAINSPVQSFANELNLMAIIQLAKEFSRAVYRPIGTVHDSILAYVRVDWVERVCKRTMEVMTHPDLMDELGIELEIPIESEITIGPWGAGKKWHSNTTSERRATRSTASRTARSPNGRHANTRSTSGISKRSEDGSRRKRYRSAA